MKRVAEAVNIMERVSALEDRLDELSKRVKRDPELQELPEWRAILDRMRASEMDFERLTIAEFEDLERWARRVRVWRTLQNLD